ADGAEDLGGDGAGQILRELDDADAVERKHVLNLHEGALPSPYPLPRGERGSLPPSPPEGERGSLPPSPRTGEGTAATLAPGGGEGRVRGPVLPRRQGRPERVGAARGHGAAARRRRMAAGPQRDPA